MPVIDPLHNNSKPETTAVVPPVAEAVEDTATPKFDNVYDFLNSGRFGVSSESIDRFNSSWYAFVWRDTYKGFQQFGVVFPFEYVIQDSVGEEKKIFFNSINEISEWRKNECSGLNSWGLAHFGSPRKLVWEGYPGEMYGKSRYEQLPDHVDSTVVIITYLFPQNRVDYYFQQKDGIWKVYKRIQKQYKHQTLKEFSQQSFEGFLLRFISDKPFRMSRVKWPLEFKDYPVDSDTVIIRLINAKDFDIGFLHMAIYQGAGRNKIDSDTMYLYIMDEGGGNCGSVFTKIKGRWTLIEEWDASN